MAGGVEFDEAAARGLEAAYQTTSVVEQRSAVVRALCLAPGQQVLDIGSGPGLLLRELALCVGPGGAAVGLDLSAPMIEVARR
ncbi:MAG TPA: methyltransferase domain-containing protein, partial [Planctomycetota bacterium]|nr:methyltransferase domain-containing protein [Planctomycetota bacterium]